MICEAYNCDEPAERLCYNTSYKPPLKMSFCLKHEKYHKYGETFRIKEKKNGTENFSGGTKQFL